MTDAQLTRSKPIDFDLSITLRVPSARVEEILESLALRRGTPWRSAGALLTHVIQQAESMAPLQVSPQRFRAAVWEVIQRVSPSLGVDPARLADVLTLDDAALQSLLAGAPLISADERIYRDAQCHFSAARILGVPEHVLRGTYEYAGIFWCAANWGMSSDFIAAQSPRVTAEDPAGFHSIVYHAQSRRGFPLPVFQHLARLYPWAQIRVDARAADGSTRRRFEHEAQPEASNNLVHLMPARGQRPA